MDESAEARQKYELEALKAIYGEDLVDLRVKAAWNRWAPLKLAIALQPTQGMSGTLEVYATVVLHISCPENYPKSVPKLELGKSKGLSDSALEELQRGLEEKTTELQGEEMIFQLCQLCQDFLHIHNKPASKSFYDEMLQRRKEKEEKDFQARRLEEDKHRHDIQVEVQKRQEMLKTEVRLRREFRKISESSNNDNDERRHSLSNNSPESSDDYFCDHKNPIVVEFTNRDIQRGRCLKHCSFNHAIFIGMDLKTGESVLLSEWLIQVRSHHDLTYVSRQLSSIEQEINYLTKLRHANLAHYLGFKYEQVSDDKTVVHVLKEFINGPNCSFFMNENFSASVAFIKYVSKGVLTALDYLHRNNVVHKDLRESCVYITGKGSLVLTNYSIHKRITDLSSEFSNSTYYSKKTDIYNFGLFLLSLLNSAPATSEDIPKSVPSDLYDFLTQCLCRDEKERSTTTKLLSHSFICQPLVHFSPHKQVIEATNRNNHSPELPEHDSLQFEPSSRARLTQEFVIIQHLGKGAFGDVTKVQNVLDGQFYAIKRINLNPKNRQLNRKIVREVKLLSRLNHENVVRYFNSWIEEMEGKAEESELSSLISQDKVPRIYCKDEFTMSDNIEEMAPSVRNSEVTFDSKSQGVFDSSSDDDSSDGENNWGVFNEKSDSDGIEFERDSAAESSSEASTHSRPLSVDQPHVDIVQQLYIQMEYCDKSTLRAAIDNHVYLDENRVWRMFREIVEGLAYIHEQGIIHRDLKPVNVFIDFEDHVKIGDFGLATNIKPNMLKSYETHLQLEGFEESKTGLIGTALYVAPEASVGTKAFYDQKVDIYSLGIIFFEMCYKPLDTNMERIKILTGLRQKEIVFPEEFNKKENSKQEFLIKWLLNHDFSKRPTSVELLQSEHVPPPVLEECELRELVRHTISNPQLKGYKYLIASCFNQTLTPAQDITYDKDPLATNVTKPFQLQDYVREVIAKIFRQHGAQNVPTPLLMPKSQHYEGAESCVRLMTHFGGIVQLPHDLRVPFARYVAWNSITLLRRYSIERVYREKKVFGFQPRELYECAFDIVTPTPGNLMSDAELLYLVYEIITELPAVKNKHFIIRLNHTSLIKGILLHFGVKECHGDVFQLISDVKDGKVYKNQLQNFLIGLGLSDNSIATLINIFNSEVELSKATNHFQMITKKRSGDASHLAKQALQELKTIATNAVQAFGVTFEIVIAPGALYNSEQYSGMICQFVCEIKKKHKMENMEVLAAGGRYDSMILSYRRIMEDASMLSRDIKQSAVGVSLSLDKFVQVVREQGEELMPLMGFLDVAVCSVGSKLLLKEKTKILKSLWAVGIRCSLIDSTNIEEIQEQCTELRIPHVIMLKDSEQGTARVRSWERDRFQEKTFKIPELVENMQRIIKTWKETPQEFPLAMSRSDSKTYACKSDVTVCFVTVDKLSSNARKRHESQVRSHLENLFKRLNGCVTVLGLSTDAIVLKTIASHLDCDTEGLFHSSVESIIERHQRHKKYLTEVCDEIYEHKSQRTKPIIILFSLPDSAHRILA